MRGNPLLGNGGNGLGCRLHILTQAKSESGGSERRPVSIYENRFVGFSWLTSHQRGNQIGGFRPNRRDALLASLGGHDQLQLMPPARVKLSGSRSHTTRCSDGSTSSSRTATAGEAIASISTTTPVDCGRSLPVGPTLSRRIRLWLWPRDRSAHARRLDRGVAAPPAGPAACGGCVKIILA